VAFGCGRQLTPLVGDRLLIGADAQVQCDLLCHVTPQSPMLDTIPKAGPFCKVKTDAADAMFMRVFTTLI
jgi:hypothetical protein